MAKLPKNLTVSANSPYQLLARLSVTERLALLNSASGRTYLDSLTPTEYALLFPSYYKKDQTKFMKGGTAQPVSGGLTRASYTPSEQPSAPSATRGAQPAPRQRLGGQSQSQAPAQSQPAPSPNAMPGWKKKLDEIAKGYGGKDEPSSSPSSPSSGYVNPGPGEKLNPAETIKLAAKIAKEMGFDKMPPDGRSYGMRTGSSEEWGRVMWALILKESGGVQPEVDANGNPRPYRTTPERERSGPYRSLGIIQQNWQWNRNVLKTDKDLLDVEKSIKAVFDRWQRKGLHTGKVDLDAAEHTGFGTWSAIKDKIPAAFSVKLPKQEVKPEEKSPDKKRTRGLPKSADGVDELIESKGMPPVETDPEKLKKLNKERPSYSGDMTVYMEGVAYPGGSGRPNLKESMPIGTFDIQSGTWKHSRYSQFRDNSFYVKNMFDEKLGRMREGMLIHSQTDLDKLYSAGCIAINRKHWKKFKAHMLDYMKRVGPIAITRDANNVAYIAPRGAVDPRIALLTPEEVIKGREKVPENVDPKDLLDIEKSLPKGISEELKKEIVKKALKIPEERRQDFLKELNKPEVIQELEGMRKKIEDTSKNPSEANKKTEQLVKAVEEDIMPESLLDLRVKTFDRGDVTLRELGVTKFSELTEKGGQAFAGGANDRTTTLLARDFQDHFGENFGRITAQNDLWHKSNRAPGTSHRTGRKIDFTLNDGDYRGGHKSLSTYLSEKYGMKEGKDFKIISRPHGDGPHMDFELTPSGREKVSAVLEPKTKIDKENVKASQEAPEAPLEQPATTENGKIVYIGAGITKSGNMRDPEGILDRKNAREYYRRLGYEDENIRFLKGAGQTREQQDSILKAIRDNPNGKITIDAFSGAIGSLKRVWHELTDEERKRVLEVIMSGGAYKGRWLANETDFPGTKFTNRPDIKGHYSHYEEQLKRLQEQEPRLIEPVRPAQAPAQAVPEQQAPVPAQPQSEAPAPTIMAPTDGTIVTTVPQEEPKKLVYGGEVSNSVQPSKTETEGSKLQTKDDRTPIYNDRGDVSALYNPQKEMLYYDPRSGKNVVEPRNRVNTDQLYGRDIERSQTIKDEGNDEAISNAVDTVYSKVMTDMRQMIPTNNSNLQSDMTNIANLTENIMQNPTMERFNARRQFKESSNLSKGNYYNFGQSNRI